MIKTHVTRNIKKYNKYTYYLLNSYTTFGPDLTDRSIKERPIPLIFIGGEGLNPTTLYHNSVGYFANNGYSGLLIEYPSHCDSIDSAVSFIRSHLKNYKSAPPVIVAHSISSFIVQKYLESYSASAIILVNPLPPEPSRATINLFDLWLDNIVWNDNDRNRFSYGLNSKDTLLRYYYGIVDDTNAVLASQHQSRGDYIHQVMSNAQSTLNYNILSSKSFESKLYKDSSNTIEQRSDKRLSFPAHVSILKQLIGLDDNSNSFVNLEPGSVPTMLITSSGDTSILDLSDKDKLTLLWRVPDDYSVHLSHSDAWSSDKKVSSDMMEAIVQRNRLPMLTHPVEFNSKILNFVETFT